MLPATDIGIAGRGSLAREDGLMTAPVLVATHASPDADDVLARAAGLAAAFGTELHAVSVVPPIEIAAPVAAPGASVITDAEHRLEARAAAAIERARGVGREHGLDVVAHIRHGEPAVSIALVADEIGAGLIVVGSRGLDPAGRYVLGSVPERVLFDPHGHDVFVVRTTGT